MDLSFTTSASVHFFFLRITLLVLTGDGKKSAKAVKVSGTWVKFTQAGADLLA